MPITSSKYKKSGKKYLKPNDFKVDILKWAEKINVNPQKIQMRLMKSKWASLSKNGILTFNTELLDKSKKFCDYVIVHELLHIKVPNHGKLFKSLMFAFLPDWEKCIQGQGIINE